MLTEISPEHITESPSNPRKHFDQEKLAELAASIEEKGVLQPILVRPNGGPESYDLVFGARRLRASKLAGLESIPAIVRELTDEEVLEEQIIENAQREDVRPLEEADGFARMLGEFGRSATDIARRIGRPPEFVRRRLVLADLIEPLRELLETDRIGIGSAEALGALPERMQKELAEGSLSLDQTSYHDEPLRWTHHTVRCLIREVSRSLFEAGWDLAETGIGAQRACVGCPARSDAQVRIFDDGESARCLDGECWGAKQVAWLDRRRAEIELAGEELLEGDVVVDLLRDARHRTDSRYRLAHTNCAELYHHYTKEEAADAEPLTWGELAGDAPRTWVLREGRIEELVRVEDVVEVLEESDVPHAEDLADELQAVLGQKATSDSAKAKKKAAQEKKKLECEADAIDRREGITKIVEAVEAHGIDVAIDLLLADELPGEPRIPYGKPTPRAHYITERRTGEADDDLVHLTEQLDERGRIALYVEYMLSPFALAAHPYNREERQKSWKAIFALVQWPAPASDEPEPDPEPAKSLAAAGEPLPPRNLYTDHAEIYASTSLAVVQEQTECVHVLEAGRALCEAFDDAPGDWPEGHCWVPWNARGHATCAACVATGEGDVVPSHLHPEITSPEAAELLDQVRAGDVDKDGLMEHTVKRLREVLKAHAGSYLGASTKAELVNRLLLQVGA